MFRSKIARYSRAAFRRYSVALSAVAVLAAGCTTFSDYVHNGFKVGPNFEEPQAATIAAWIDAGDKRIASESPPGDDWWNVFSDPSIPILIETAHRENLDLKTAGTRILQAQAQRNIAAGNLFPQSQNAIGDYAHVQIPNGLLGPQGGLPSSFNIWAVGLNTSWELDFWGSFRRRIEASNADLGGSVEAYRDALVTLLADVVTNYVQMRTYQQRIVFARRNVEIQKGSLRLAEARLADGKATALDVKQAHSLLDQTESTIPPFVIGLRQTTDRLCTLLGQPAQNLMPYFNDAPIPEVPPTVAAGIPADLLHRRPDVRKALQTAASQCAKIGVAEADFYPQFGVSGFVGFATDDIATIFAGKSFTALILPNFSWKILNYGRVLNNVRYQDAKFQETVLQYQQTVLNAGRETEDALVAFIQYQIQARSLEDSVKDAEDSVELVQAQYRGGLVDFNRVFTTQLQLVTQQDQLAIARGNIALSLISVYRALGGGWQAFENCPEPGKDRKGK
ncbi:MAG TPA: efflux transporter outer membrane subunit [Gemmata sp.]|jgi:NodT family efflux transporter outer membrane factor (OMF) lipoprotein|nr:efflux transporter outer membrane subunit [Gemmata sp.]